jgi:hypothetical protein
MMAVAAATRIAVVVVAALAALAPGARGLRRDDFPVGFLFGAATSAYQVGWSIMGCSHGGWVWSLPFLVDRSFVPART